MRRSSGLVAATLLVVAACGRAQDASLIPSLERLAASDHPAAVYHLGMAYHTGSGVVQDHAKALAAFRRAAELGDPLAAYKLGCYYDGQGGGLVTEDAATALRYKLVAAEAGYALAQQDVAALYARRGDTAAALAWLEKSAAQGWDGGLMALASVHNGAAGFPRDPAKTAAYFKLFLDRSDPDESQAAWLTNFEAGLSPEQRRSAETIVRDYRPLPTALTLEALSGQRAAQALVTAASRK